MAAGIRAAAAVALALVLGSAGTRAAEDSPAWVKASFLYHLTRYTTWPDTAFSSKTAPIVIAVVGDSAVADEVRKLTAGQQVEGRGIEVRKLAVGEPLPRAHLVLLPANDFEALKSQATSLRDTPTLRVAESERFATAVGDVGFRLVRGRVSFDINRDNTRRHGLKVSSKLMNLASNVQ
jgi:hypothetical protein